MLKPMSARGNSTSAWVVLAYGALGCSGSFSSAETDPISVGAQGGRAGRGGTEGATSPGGAPGAAGRAPVGGAGGAPGVGGFVSGAGGGTPGAAGRGGGALLAPAPPPCDAVNQVLLPSCGSNACHGNPRATIGDFGLLDADLRPFVDKPSVRNPSCGFVIDSGDPSQSLLLRKLTGDFDALACGAQMPASGPDLTLEQIDCMESWLQQFAE
jgi:hypothetical protein